MKYTEDMITFLSEYVPGHSRKEINAEFNKRFGTDLPESSTTSFYKRMGFKTGNTGRFENGRECPWKGKKQTEYMSPEGIERSKATRFQKGNTPHNHKPIGSERVDTDGYIKIKVGEPNIWIHKHRVLWEQHYGPIPENGVVIFLDRNPLNCCIENLGIINKSQLGIMNSYGLFSEDPEITRTGMNFSKFLNVLKGAENGNSN